MIRGQKYEASRKVSMARLDMALRIEHPGTAPGRRRRGFGWYATFVLLAVVAFITIYYFTGRDALGATARFLWNGVVLAGEALINLLSGLLGWLARGMGWRRLSRLSAVIAGVGLGYAGSVVMSDRALHLARGWRAKLVAIVEAAGHYWNGLSIFVKVLVVVVLITSQIYLHTVLILFPIAFLVPVVRNLWVRGADLVFGKWYWRTFGAAHRAAVNVLRRMPVIRSLIGATRLLRIRYLCAWRLWRYHPRYRNPESTHRRVSLLEPIRLWRRGELDRYIGRPLLARGRLTNEDA